MATNSFLSKEFSIFSYYADLWQSILVIEIRLEKVLIQAQHQTTALSANGGLVIQTPDSLAPPPQSTH